MRRRIAVCGDDWLDVTGEEGFVATSWDTMRAYACIHRGQTSGRTIERETNLRNDLYRSSYGEDALVDARDHFTDASLDASLLPEVCHAFASLADDNASILGANEGAEGQGIGAAGGGRAGLRGRAWRRTR